MVYYKAGEPLHLNHELAGMALKEQQIAMEVDEREGMVRDYLEMLLPERWDRMDMYDRRNYICGSDFGGEREPGVRRRERVCNMEIWCECFGKERGNLKRQEDVYKRQAQIGEELLMCAMYTDELIERLEEMEGI